MTVFPIIVDSRPAYTTRGPARQSLLLMPLGCGVLLHWLAERLRGVTDERLLIAPIFPVDDEYTHALRAARVPLKGVISERTRSFLESLEPSDLLLIIDPRCLPLSAQPFRRLFPAATSLRGARYQVALDRTHEGTREFVQLDSEGRVRRIQRYYEGHTWIQTQAVATALVPVSCVWDIAEPHFTDLPRLRRDLASSGALGEDEPVTGPTADLSTESGYLQLTQVVGPHAAGFATPTGYKNLAPDVIAGPGCKVDPQARLYGPLVLQDRCVVAKDAIIIGPSVIGRGAYVGEGSTVAKSVLAPDSEITPNSVVAQRCVGGEVSGRNLPDKYVFAEDARVPVALLDDRPLSAEQQHDSRRESYLPFKYAMDILLATLALILLSPLLIVTAIAVKLSSKGPVFFAHSREGLNGRPFRCWKFRTMVMDAVQLERELARETNEVDGPQFKLSNDPRVTPLGKFLRNANIDELPQLFNVLRGEMSLIGPRPSPFRENQICVPWRMARLSVRPGITGLWQICRREREAGDFHQWIFYDILYAKNVSFMLDLRILVWTVLTGGGKRSIPLRWLLSNDQIHASSAPVIGELQTLADSQIVPAPLMDLTATEKSSP